MNLCWSCRWHNRRHWDMHHLPHWVRQDTAAAGWKKWGSKEVQWYRWLCQEDCPQSWVLWPLSRSVRPVVWLNTQVSLQVGVSLKLREIVMDLFAVFLLSITYSVTIKWTFVRNCTWGIIFLSKQSFICNQLICFTRIYNLVSNVDKMFIPVCKIFQLLFSTSLQFFRISNISNILSIY